MYRYTWNEFGRDFTKVTQTLKKCGRRFTEIYCASPAGLPFAMCLSRYMDIDLRFDHRNPPLERERNGELIYDANLLIVDDVANTGLTLGELHRAGFFIVTLIKHPKASVTPDLYMKELDTNQVLFPWQAEKAPVKS